jgi:hypothetical protein
MKQDQLDQQLLSYSAWREQLIQTVENFHAWLEGHDKVSPEQELRIFEAIDAMRKDRLTLAFVAEFSRGKTELINALFFAHYGSRLLPSAAGRTTMCPTELFYDKASDTAYIHLLPIETRLMEQSIADLKHERIHWTQIALDIDNPEQVTGALREVIRTKQASVERARELGLYDESNDPYYCSHGKPPEQVEIPHWRHALISFPHTLLKQGLVVLDTPGLNAMGHEPELTLNMLPSAQAVLFLLGADAGVTRSDMDMWQHHVRTASSQPNKNLLVVLNKIDTLWDELKDSKAIGDSIESQRRASAKQLQIDISRVFPISAQKGLIAKVRKDQALLAESRLPELENYIANTVLPNRQTIVRDNLVAQIGGLIDDNLAVLQRRQAEISKLLTELRSLRGKNADVIMHLMNKSREEQAAYLRNVESFQNSRRLLQNQARNMLDTLSMDNLDRLINKTRESMTNSWTTAGMKRGMETFFNGTRDTMEQLSTHAEQTRMLIRATYRKFHEEHGLPQITPKQFSVSSFSTELERLYQEADAFRRSPVTTMTEQSYVIKRFFISLVSHTRSLFFKANQDANLWLKDVMNPLVKQIKEHKVTMEKRLETLRRISESRDTLEVRIKELDIELRANRQQLETLNQLYRSLHSTENQDDSCNTSPEETSESHDAAVV